MIRRPFGFRLLPVSLLVAALVLGPVASRAGDLDYGRGASHRAVLWRSDDGSRQAQGLVLHRHSERTNVDRLLLIDPEGRRIVVTRALDARSGLESTTLEDEESRWWARLEVDFGLRGTSLGDFFSRAQQIEGPAAPSPCFTLSTSTSFSAAACVAWDAPDPYARFFAELESRGLAGELAGAVPDALRPAVEMLALARAGTPASPGATIETLQPPMPELAGLLAAAAAFDAGERAAAQRPGWTVELAPLRGGATIHEPELLELTSRFSGSSNTDPLSDIEDRPVPAVPDPRPEPGELD